MINTLYTVTLAQIVRNGMFCFTVVFSELILTGRCISDSLSAYFCSPRFRPTSLRLSSPLFPPSLIPLCCPLWINIIMDTFAALALVTDPASEKLALHGGNVQDDSATISLSNYCHPCFPLIRCLHICRPWGSTCTWPGKPQCYLCHSLLLRDLSEVFSLLMF
jgi:hypothetical protein